MVQMFLIAVLCFSVTVALSLNNHTCPHVNSIFPPSGSPSVAFRLNGTNLLQLAAFRVLQDGQQFGGDQPLQTASNETLSLSLQFLLASPSARPESGQVAVVLVPTDRTRCVLEQVWIEFRPYDPSAALIVPSAGQAGTLVRIGVGSYPPHDGDSSRDFTVKIGGVEASFVSKGERILVIRAPPGDTNVSVPIEVVTQYGNHFPLGQWTHLPQGRVSSLSPAEGQKGTLVTIHGEHLLGHSGSEDLPVGFSLSEVWLGGTLAQVVRSDDSEVVVLAGSGPSGVGDVQVLTTQVITDHVSVYSGQGPSLVLSSAWTQLKDGEVSDIVPPYAQEGSWVFLCGKRLLGGGTTVTSVSFGENMSSNFTSAPVPPPWSSNASSECVKAVVPGALPAKSLEVTITSDTMAVVKTRSDVLFSSAAITSLLPTSGQQSTVVNITGRHLSLGLDDTPIVTIAGIPAAIVAMDTSTDWSWITVAAGWTDNTSLPLSGPVELTVSHLGEHFSLSSSPLTWTYLPTGVITSVKPSRGQVGTVVSITGESLLGYGETLESVFIGNASAAILSISNEEVIAKVSNGSETGVVRVTLVASSGAVIEADDLFEVREPGLITALEPSSGQWGTRVVIHGSHLFAHADNITNVNFGGILATIDHASSNASMIHVRVGPCRCNETFAEKVVITSSAGAVVSSAVAAWTYSPSGCIQQVLPGEGENGTVVTILGRGLLGGGSDIPLVYLNRVLAEVLSATDSSIVVRNGELARADPSQPDNVRIEAASGAIVEGGYFVQRERGVITGFSPTSGQEGTYLTVTGLAIANRTVAFQRARVAGVEVDREHIQVMSDSSVVLRVGGAPVGTSGSIELVREDGVTVNSRTPYGFSYSDPGKILGISPEVGVEGDVVHIFGQYLVPKGGSVAMVSLSGSSVSRVVRATAEEIVVTAGAVAMQNSSGKVLVEASDGRVTEGGPFVYLHNFSLAVVQGPSTGQFGTQLALQLPFPPNAATMARVGHTAAQVLSIDSSNWTIQIAVPRSPDPHPNTADISIHDITGRVARLSRGFQYLREGHILSVLPSAGQNGTRVVIRGLQLLGGGADVKRVCLGGVQAIVEHANDSEMTVKAAHSGTARVGDVEVVSDTGARVLLLDGWEYVTPASIQSVTPLRGQFGTRVEIRGVGLLGGGMEARTVVLNGAEVHSVESSEDTNIIVRVGSPSLHPSPLPEEGPAIVVVVSDTVSTVVSHNPTLTFQYTAPGKVVRVNPSNGTGGTEVFIEGEGLLGGGASVVEVYLAGVAVLSMYNISNHSITVVAGFLESGEALSGGSVVIESDTGALVVLENGWSYMAECPLGQFHNSSSELCDHCHRLCVHCNGPRNSDCFECSRESFWTRDSSSQSLTCVAACPLYATVEHECVTVCQSHQFAQPMDAGGALCQDCSQQCDSHYGCKGPSAAECVRCVNVSYQGVCAEDCPLGHYLEYASRFCLPCHPQCDSSYNCSGPSAADCHTCKHLAVENSSSSAPLTWHCVEECPTGYYQHHLRCLACHPYCREGCVGPSPSQCTGCAGATLRYSNGSTLCIPTCDTSLHYQDLDGVCQPCHHLCSTQHGCRGPTAGDCWMCMEHSFLLDGVCVTVCPTGYFNSTRLCLPCDSSCKQGCSGRSSKDCFYPGVDPFESGIGTTSMTVVVAVGLSGVVLILIVLLVCVCCRLQRHDSLRKKVTRMLRPVSRTLSSRNSIKRKESIKVSLSRRSSMLRRENFLGTRDPEPINPLVRGDVLEHPDDYTHEQFRVTGPSGQGAVDLCFVGSDEASDSNPYQEIPMIQLLSAHTDPERITLASQNSSHDEIASTLAGEESDGFTMRISFDSPDEPDTRARRVSRDSASRELKKGAAAEESGRVQETRYYNLDDAVLKADMSRIGLQEHYDRPRKVKRRNLSTSFINTAHYDAPTSHRVAHGTPQLFDRNTPSSTASSHPYATPSLPMRRKSDSGARLHRVQKPVALPLPRPRPQPPAPSPSPSDHVYATVKKLGQSDSDAHYDTPNEVGTTLPAGHAPRKDSGQAEASSVKKLLGWWVKGEPRPYEVPTGISPPHGASAGANAPLPPIPVPAPELPQQDQDIASCEVPSSPLSERIYEEAFCGFDDNFVLVSTVSSPPALPERRQTKPTPNQPASQPLTQDVEIIWTPPPAERHSDSDDSTDMELPLSQQYP